MDIDKVRGLTDAELEVALREAKVRSMLASPSPLPFSTVTVARQRPPAGSRLAGPSGVALAARYRASGATLAARYLG